MKTRTQIRLDKLIVKPFAYVMNLFARFLGFILRIDHNLDREFKTIAICKFKGMGSIIQATPMIKMLRKNHPESKIIFVSTKANQTILKQIEAIDEIILVDDSNIWKFIGTNCRSLLQLMKMRPYIYYDLEIYSNYSSLFTLFSLSVNRVGFYLRSSAYRTGIYTHMMFFNSTRPIADVYQEMARMICKDESTQTLFEPKGTAPQFEISNPYIVINPNASDLRLERRWPKENFLALIKSVLERYENHKIVLVGSPSESEYTQSVISNYEHSNLLNLSGKTSIEELIYIIKNATLMITNDTGPMHISFATRTYTLALFGPCSPDQYGTSENVKVFYKNTYCSPCVHDFEIPPCKGDNICMKQITTKEVLNAVDEFI